MAVTFIAIYGGMLFYLTLVVLVQNKQRLNDPDLRVRYAFLYNGYKPQYYYAFVLLMRRLLLGIAAVVAPPTYRHTELNAFANVCHCSVVIVCLSVHLHSRPFFIWS